MIKVKNYEERGRIDNKGSDKRNIESSTYLKYRLAKD